MVSYEDMTIGAVLCKAFFLRRSWESRKYLGYLIVGCDGYGYNLFDGSYSLTGIGGATRYEEGRVDLVVDRIGDATFRLRLINRLDGHYLSEIPEFDVNFTVGGFTQTVIFKDGEAVAAFDVAMALSDVTAIISKEVQKSAHFNIEITEGYSSSNRDYDPGLEKGDAWDNPDPIIPKFPFENENTPPYIPPVEPEVEPEPSGYGNGTGNGQGTGNGTGTGDGNGNGSAGTFGSGKNNLFGEVGEPSGIISNITGIGDIATSDSPSSDKSNGMDRSSEGGSDAGSGETIKAYEVSKVINLEKSDWKFVLAAVLVSCIIVLGYAYRKRRDDGFEL